jgi:hypothetical protein
VQVEAGAERGREIGGGARERLVVQRGVADEREGRAVRQVEPLVAVDRDRVGELQPVDQRRGARAHAEERAERSVDVQPDALLLANARDRAQGIARAGVGRARVGDRDRGVDAGRAIAPDRVGERLGIEPEIGVDRDPADAVGAEPERPQRLHVRVVELGAAVDRDLRQCAHAGTVDVDAERAARGVAGDRERDEVGARGAAREGRAAPRDRQ